ncbi:MAG: PfkB family carbohydrate kinase [Planctomycetota bacterium]
MNSTPSKPCVVGIGEALFDVFNAGPRLGGAPLNVAVQSHRLLHKAGGEGRVISKIANDDLGKRLLERLDEEGVATSSIQRGGHAPTGRVEVEQHNDGSHTFHIAEASAWDEIEFDDSAASLARACDAVAFGTLAQRHPHSRQAIQSFLAAAPQAIKLFDVNFRTSNNKDFFDAQVVTAGCEAANLVKVNDEELERACELAGVADAPEMLKRFDLRAIILTQGAKGTTALTAAGWVDGAAASFERAEGADTVGAGDACTAGLLSALSLGHPLPKALDLANQMGAFVANQPGATPPLPPQLLDWLG